MGRHSLTQIEAVRRFHPDIELDALLRPGGREACRRTAPGLDTAEIPAELCAAFPDSASRPGRLGREADYADWLRGLRPDAFLQVTPFLVSLEPFPPVPSPCPTVVNLYDLIPLVYRKQHLFPSSGTARDYLFVLSRLAGADAFVAISAFTRREAMSYLGLPGGRINVGYPIPAQVFRRARPERRRATLERLGLRSRDDGGYVLTVTREHRFADVSGANGGFALLSSEDRVDPQRRGRSSDRSTFPFCYVAPVLRPAGTRVRNRRRLPGGGGPRPGLLP